MFIVYSILILSLILLSVIFRFTYNEQIENFQVEQLVVKTIDETKYTLKNDYNIAACLNSKIKPTDVFFTNITHFFNISDVSFIGVSIGKRVCMVVAKKQDIYNVNKIPINAKIAYSYENDKILFDHIFKSVYNVEYDFINLTNNKFYVNEYCDSFDQNDNMFIDFMVSDHNYFVFSLNDILDNNFLKYFDSYFNLNNRLHSLKFVDHNAADDDKFVLTRLQTYLFNSVLDAATPHIIKLDNIIYQNNNESIDFDKLIANEIIDFNTSQLYIELYYDNIPNEINSHFINFTNILDIKVDDLKNTENSCSASTKIKHLGNYSFNLYGINSYKSDHCNVSKNLFIDIIYPFSSKYEIKISSSDFNTLKIFSNFFDDIIPIRNALMYNNTSISRYKINVNPEMFPNEAFIDDIYYGSYKDDDNYTILTNSIPFELNTNDHEIYHDDKNGGDVIYIIMKNQYMFAKYSYNNETISVKLMEGDRVFINQNSIFDTTLSNYIDQKLINNRNFSHGFIRKKRINDIETFVVEIDDIRLTSNKQLIGGCFDTTLNLIGNDSAICKIPDSNQKSWEERCKYNYECPFFQSNSNYTNNFGGCQFDGNCQMPKGITRQSFKKYLNDEKNHPVCYNCSLSNKTDEECCDNFKTNDDLNSPDYMFENDTNERIKHLFTLKESNKGNTILVNKYV